MIRFIIALCILALSTAVGYFIKTFPAAVKIPLPDKTITVNFVVWILLSLVVAYLLILLLKFVLFLWRSPQIFSRSAKIRKTRKANNLLKSGLNHMISGHYAKAENALAKGAQLSEELGQDAVIYYENAAIAATQQQALDRRDRYLLKARQTAEGKQKRVTYLAEAEMYVNSKDYAKARPLLEDIQRREPNNAKLLLLLDQTYAAQKDWQPAWRLLPKLRMQLTHDAFEQRRQQYAKGLLNDTPEIDSYEQLAKAWKKLPSDMKSTPEMVIEYANALVNNEHSIEAEKLLAAQLKRNHDLAMLQAYSQLDNVDYNHQLRTIKSLAGNYKEESLYHYAYALIAYKAEKLEIANTQIETALTLKNSPESFALWAQILEAQNQPEAALIAYRQSIERVKITQALEGDLLPAPKEDKPADA